MEFTSADFNESYFIIHSFIAPKIVVLYACKVLKTFNYHLNCKREFTMITRKIILDAVYGSSILSSLLFTLDISNKTEYFQFKGGRGIYLSRNLKKC